MKIAGYLQTSLIEWPGKIASVIFVPGCNFRCPFCHNSTLVDSDKVTELQSFKEGEVLADLRKRKKWVDGVVVTGGEPLLQTDLSGFLSRCKRMGFETMLETNGSLHTILHSMICKGLVDFVAMDYKTTFEDYAKVVYSPSLENSLKTLRGLVPCPPKNRPSSRPRRDVGVKRREVRLGGKTIPRSGGKTNKKLKNGEKVLVTNIKKSIGLLLSSDLPFEFRTTVVPGIHDEEVLLDMARDLKRLITNHSSLITVRWILQNFQPKNCLDPEFEKKKPYDIKKLEGFLRAVKRIIPGAGLRGN